MRHIINCENCKKQVQAKRSHKKFCSEFCRKQSFYTKGVSGFGEIKTAVTPETKFSFSENTNPDYAKKLTEVNQLSTTFLDLGRQELAVESELSKTYSLEEIASMVIGGGSLLYLWKANEDFFIKLTKVAVIVLFLYIIGKKIIDDSKNKAQAILDSILNRKYEVYDKYEIAVSELKLIPEKLSELVPVAAGASAGTSTAGASAERSTAGASAGTSTAGTAAGPSAGTLESLIQNTEKRKDNFVSSKQIKEMSFKKIKFDKNFEWLGELGEPFEMVIFGKPGSGKSTFCFEFANYLAGQFGKVGFFSLEEGIKTSTHDKIVRFNLHDLVYFSIKNPLEIDLVGHRFIFIDSVNSLGILPESLEILKRDNPHVCFINVLQSTKDGNFRGSNAYTHNADIVLRVDAGKIEIEKNRFGAKGSYQIPDYK